MQMRYLLLAMGLAWVAVALPQPPDAVIIGELIDAVTGDTIREGHVDLRGVNSSTTQDRSYISIYRGLDVPMFFGEDLMLYFSAPGYTTRIAAFDLSGQKRHLVSGSLVEVRMDIPLTRHADPAHPDTNARRMGKCRFDGGREMVWSAGDTTISCHLRRSSSNEHIAGSRMLQAVRASVPIAVIGSIVDHWTDKPLAEAEVEVKGSDGTVQNWRLDGTGKYKGALEYDRTYSLVYRCPGKVSKTVVVDTQAIPSSERLGGFGMDLNMRLFAELSGEDLGFLREPIGKAAFAPGSGVIEWDMDYSGPRLQRLKEILDRHR